jgi:CubicO group peptidase (beta-lactamase class C family)
MKQTVRRLSLPLLLATLAAAPARAQDPAQDSAPHPAHDPASHPRVQQALALAEVWLDAQRDYLQIPGLSVGIVYDQHTLWSRGFGYADRERRTPATPATLYSICSISKLFTGIGVMQLRDAGRLRLDDPVARHLDWFRIRRTDPDAPEVTVAGILTHSSGLPRETAHPYWTGPEFAFPTREQIIESISSQETLYPAYTYYQYSNLGLTLAGEVVAAASGAPYEEYVRKHVLEPLGLRSTYIDMPEQHRGGRLATGYSAITRQGAREPVRFFAARGIAPAAGYASSVEDLARFAAWQFRVLDRKGGEEVLSRNSLREMQRVHWVDPDFETTRGLGFGVWRSGNQTFVGHGGSCPGFRSQLLLKPDEKVAAIFMANAQGVNASQFAQRLYDIVSPALKAAVTDTAAAARQPDASLARYAGIYDLGFAGEMAVVQWEDGLAAVGLPTMDPLQELTRLRKVGEHTFRRVREHDQLGETVVFEIGPDGRATRMVWHSNQFRRVR